MSDPRRQLPSVDALLAEESVAALQAQHPRALVVRAVRAVLHAAREDGGAAPAEGWARAVSNQLGQLAAPSLIPVINATGVVLHTNLGRALLAASAVRAMTAVAQSYASVEYDLGRGARGSRHAICRVLLMELTGAEDALVVNNAAAALLLALSALARDGDAIVSRGELVEIGGAFRVPDVMARSGTTLVEVGTTNRTHLDDYVRAITPRTRALLKVHRSNFRVTGFTAEVGAAEIAQLARASGAASLYDLGSGLLLDLSPWGLTGEPTVREAVASNVDIVVCSGDKLLGGPQAGIVLGKKQAIAACKTDPLARAVRSDKFTLAGLEATLGLYRDEETARREIPSLRMLTEDIGEIRRRGEAILKGVGEKGVGLDDVGRKAFVELIDGFSEVGGGSFPDAKLPTCLVRLTGRPRPSGSPLGPDRLIELLRAGDPPIIARIEDDHVMLDPRTILPGQEEMVARGIRAALDE
jgi:L-seryl-tRNA(Ser) seleniumtransferase